MFPIIIDYQPLQAQQDYYDKRVIGLHAAEKYFNSKGNYGAGGVALACKIYAHEQHRNSKDSTYRSRNSAEENAKRDRAGIKSIWESTKRQKLMDRIYTLKK